MLTKYTANKLCHSHSFVFPASTQRPKLNLKPRSIPKEEEQSGGTSPQANPTGRSSSIFGAAKPVDTAVKEREVEERLKKEQERLQRQLDDDKHRPTERRPRDRYGIATVDIQSRQAIA